MQIAQFMHALLAGVSRMMNILLVETDDAEVNSLEGQLNRHGYRVKRVISGRAALRSSRDVDMILLDLELPDLDGVEVCKSIRAYGSTPLIAFTPAQAHLDRVLSLQAGADDCLARPFEFRELVARMNAVLRRTASRPVQEAVITYRSLAVDPGGRRVSIGNRQISLTRKEFDLLYFLVSNPDTVVSRKELMSRVWTDEWGTSSRTVDTHISTLRNKLGHGDWIVTVRGIGYRMGTATVCLHLLGTEGSDGPPVAPGRGPALAEGETAC